MREKKFFNYSSSKQLIKNTHNFLHVKYYTFADKLFKRYGTFYGWGRKKSGQEAMQLAEKHHTSYVLLEDGFIRSIGLGVRNKSVRITLARGLSRVREAAGR